jgi:hypothetical protein
MTPELSLWAPATATIVNNEAEMSKSFIAVIIRIAIDYAC